MRLPPVYPAAIAVAYVLAVFASSPVPTSDLIRPLWIAVVVALMIQVLATIILRDRDRGALATAILLALVPLQPFLIVALLGLLAFMTIPGRLAQSRGGTPKPVPWGSATHLLNLIGLLIVVISVGQLITDGRLAPPRTIAEPLASANHDLPDIYVILLDGHPRWDTLVSGYGYDSEPFLADLRAEGFEVARGSRSNYNMTGLTFASMFQMRHLRDMPELAGALGGDTDAKRTSLLFSNLISRAPGFDELHRYGYEVIGITSEFTRVAPSADRMLDTGQINEFEIGLLTESRLRTLAPDQVRGVVAGQHRDRVLGTFEQLRSVAKQRPSGPRFVFAHIVSPHPPPVFGPGGVPRDGWPCFPASCSFWVTGEPHGHEDELTAVRDQVAYVDALTLETARSIVATSARPPVIVLMSDHGVRSDLFDRTEAVRSLFIARTPDHPDLFPSDTTPVNLLPRLLNAYAGATLPLATEESYWADLETTSSEGLINLVPVGQVDTTVPPP